MSYIEKQFFNIFNVENLGEFGIKIAIALAIYVLFYLLSVWFSKYAGSIFKKLFRLKNEKFENAFSHSFSKPVLYFTRCLGAFLSVKYIPFTSEISLSINSLMAKFIRISLIIFISIAAQNFIMTSPSFFKGINEKFAGKNQTVIGFFTRLGKALIVVLTVVILLNEFGYDINGLIAGLGLSGLTFALAAQDTASNFVSGLVILMDKPFGIGDWIAVGNMEGIVEEMNFRSCRIRTFENALIAVPNNKLSGDSVTNWTKMNMRKTKITVGLVYSTSKETLQKVCDEIKNELVKISDIKTDSILVRFDNFSASSLDVVIQYNSYPVALAQHVALKEKVQYLIMDILKNNDTDFAYNSFTIYNG